MGSDALNGQELATRGVITYQVHGFETTLRGNNFLVDTVKQVDIEKQNIRFLLNLCYVFKKHLLFEIFYHAVVYLFLIQRSVALM